MTISASSATQLKPLGDRIVVRPKAQQEMSTGGIVLPDTILERQQEGEVVAAGPGRVLNNGKRLEMEVAVGDKVIYSRYAGTEFRVEDEELLIMGANDVLAKLT